MLVGAGVRVGLGVLVGTGVFVGIAVGSIVAVAVGGTGVFVGANGFGGGGGSLGSEVGVLVGANGFGGGGGVWANRSRPEVATRVAAINPIAITNIPSWIRFLCLLLIY